MLFRDTMQKVRKEQFIELYGTIINQI